MRRRAVREVVEVVLEVEEGFGGAPLGIGTPLGWSVAMLQEVDSNTGLMLSMLMLSAKEVGVASALICRGISALRLKYNLSFAR